MTVKRLARIMTAVNNLVIRLINRQGFASYAHALRIFNACPAKAFALLLLSLRGCRPIVQWNDKAFLVL
ncbi:MAG: hypothetical protein IT308_04225 [Anaerolineaceae bacterium]|nr:hypothetical protein [Anaerolineaceae bacterium]